MPTKRIVKETLQKEIRENQVKSFLDNLENRLNELELNFEDLNTKLKQVAGRMGL